LVEERNVLGAVFEHQLFINGKSQSVDLKSDLSTNPQSAIREIDLLILGAGPAGISTALHLVSKDPSWADRMILVEKAHHPRPKLCGGGVTSFGLNILNKLGFQLPLPLPQARVDDLRIKYSNRILHVKGDPVFIVFQREALDNYLAHQARERGIIIQEGETVKKLHWDGRWMEVVTNRCRYYAKAVVGADGSKGEARRLVYGRHSSARVGRTLEVVGHASEKDPKFIERYALFDFTPVQDGLQGYFWDFPSRPDGQACFNRGLYDARMDPRRSRAVMPKILNSSLAALQTDPDNVELGGHPIHWFSPNGRFSCPGLLLAGDAAGADPLFGEGIAPALGYGQVAADAIQEAVTSGDFSFRDYRRQLLLSPVGGYLLFRWYVAWWGYRFSHHAWYMHIFWTIGNLISKIAPRPKSH
jgi:menaquinone-9 beta-reductase